MTISHEPVNKVRPTLYQNDLYINYAKNSIKHKNDNTITITA